MDRVETGRESLITLLTLYALQVCGARVLGGFEMIS